MNEEAAERNVLLPTWEQHPNPRRRVSSVVCTGGVIAATSCPQMVTAFAKALLAEEIGPGRAGEGSYDSLHQKRSDPRGGGTPGGLANTCTGGVSSG